METYFMNSTDLNNTGILPNYLNTSSSDNKYLFGDNTSVEFNQFFVLKNNYFFYTENSNVPWQLENQNSRNDR